MAVDRNDPVDIKWLLEGAAGRPVLVADRRQRV